MYKITYSDTRMKTNVTFIIVRMDNEHRCVCEFICVDLCNICVLMEWMFTSATQTHPNC